MKLIFTNHEDNDNKNASVLIPAPNFMENLEGTEEEKLIYIANKDLPTGTKYEIVADDVTISQDVSFRDAWRYVSGPNEKTSEDLSLEDQLKHKKITEEEYNAAKN